MDLCFWFWSYTPIQIVISLPLWIKLTMGQLLLHFLCNFYSFSSYVWGVLVTNPFLLSIDRYILAIQQTTTHEHLWFFWSVAICRNHQKRWHYSHNNKRWLKEPQIYFHLVIPHKSHHFWLFWCILCTATPDILSSNTKFQTIFPCLMTIIIIRKCYFPVQIRVTNSVF